MYLLKQYPHYSIYNIDRNDYVSCEENVSRALTQEMTSRYTFLYGNLLDKDVVSEILNTYKIDTIIHCAAQTHVGNSFEQSISFTKHNILATHILLECARKYNSIVRFLHMSTDEVYGPVAENTTEDSGFSEHQILQPTNPYAATKAAAECLVQSYHRSFHLPILITRSNNVYGPHQYPEKLIPKVIMQSQNQMLITIHGKIGQHSRTFIYVDDLVKAVDVILHSGTIGQVYNIGGNHESTTKDVALDVLRMMEPNVVPESRLTFGPDRPFNDMRYRIDSSKVHALGWTPTVSWTVGLQKTVDWYTEYSHRFGDLTAALLAHPVSDSSVAADE